MGPSRGLSRFEPRAQSCDVQVEEGDDGASEAAFQEVCGHVWRQAVQNILGPKLQARKLCKLIQYGSDCSGLDAPYWGLSFVLQDMQAATVFFGAAREWPV